MIKKGHWELAEKVRNFI